MANITTTTRRGNALVGIVIVIALIWGVFSIFGGDEDDSYTSPNYNSTYSNAYDDYEELPEPENPYGYGSGHSAGYEWAEETGGSCDGNSDSFNEGCEEYYAQEEEYDEALNDY